MRSTVLLLRAPQEDGAPDKYESAFTTHGYRARSLAVLETVHTNAAQLVATLREGKAEYAGVVITSARACEAWRAAVETADAAECAGASSLLRAAAPVLHAECGLGIQGEEEAPSGAGPARISARWLGLTQD